MTKYNLYNTLKKNKFKINPRKIMDYLSWCDGKNSSEMMTKDELLKQLERNTISCKEVNFKVIGLSLASINTIFSIFLSVIFLKLYLNYEKN